MESPFLNALSGFEDLPAEAITEVLSCIRRMELEKGAVLLRAGDTCRYLYFVEKGFARGYYHDAEGKESTSWFWSEGEILVSLESFLRQTPTRENVELLEPAVLYRLSYANLQHLYDKYPDFNRLGRILMEEAFLAAGMINEILRKGSALEKYETLVARHPQLLQRSYLKYIASFLGITQETLSRIRKPI
ncbi:Crp/Fnr family transcriptional regulator [Lewinella sp. 4G2]|uniref:Crp/Fnr family transcriptional regulator n=1 Tax=Lewinella sp. 4G2 TaxID=1803372 RepID=UPI0007B497C9|nr:Crp/Fnr family transcriptional regulator [Lewinella sp. 4G2]OAV42597.1 hypothetical protein A3850_015230 [Lewinella sp. 4G2]